MKTIIERDTRVRISLVVGFIAFFFAGWDSLDQNHLILGVSNFSLAGANIISLLFIKRKMSTANIILLMLNAILAFIVAYGYYDTGKKTLPVAWMMVGIIYMLVSIKTYKKKELNPKNTNLSNE